MVKDILFVGWCTDKGKQYAEGFKNYIEKNGYDFIVQIGGNDGKDGLALSINETIIKQMDTCCGAIFLLPRKLDEEGKEIIISANVSFEYGYLLNRLKHHHDAPLIVKLDGLTDASLPSDLHNLWNITPKLDDIKEGESEEEAIYRQIATEYVSRTNNYLYSAFQYLTKANEITALISVFYQKRNIQISDFAISLIYYLQTCYYLEDFKVLENILHNINESESIDYLVYTKKYVSNSVDFYKKFFNNNKVNVTSDDAYNIIVNYNEISDNVDRIYNNNEIKYLLKYFIHEHIGFASTVALSNNQEYIDEWFASSVYHHALKSIEWIEKHLHYLGYIEEGGSLISFLDTRNIENKENFFFDILFASHAYGQLSNLYYRYYQTSNKKEDYEKSKEYCSYTVKCRKFIKDHFYDELKDYNSNAYETIRLDYYSALSREYTFLENPFHKKQRQIEILAFLREKEEAYGTYEGFVNNIKNNVDYQTNHTFTISVCGASGSGKTTMVNKLLEKFKAKKCLGIIEDPSKNPYLLKDTFKSQVTFYTQNLELFSSMFKENYDLLIFDRNIDDHYSLSCYRHEIGQLNDEELDVLTHLKDTIKAIAPKTDLMIYLKCSKEEYMERFKRRHRVWDYDAEQYIETMTAHYQKWYESLKEKNEFPIIVIDNTEGINEAKYQEIYHRINDGMKFKNNKL